MIIHHKTDYRERRRQDYPDIGDQLDAVFKLAKHLRENGERLPADVQRWLDQCQHVKDRYPAK